MTFLLLVLPARAQHYEEHEVKQLADDLVKDREHHAEYIVAERNLRERLQKLAPGSPEAAQLEAELAETRQVLDVLVEREQEEERRIQELKSTREYRTNAAIENDKRRPTRTDISGVWWTGLSAPRIAPYTVRLVQRGNSIRGQGYHFSMDAEFRYFDVAGTYKGRILSLTFIESPTKSEKHIYRYSPSHGHPRFLVPGSNGLEQISPWHR
jgi:hypothetical protein